MRRHLAANLSLGIVFIFVALAFLTGAKQYNHTREMIVANLNQALREAVKMHANNWLCQDTIQSYAKLQKQMGSAVTLHTYDKVFAEALSGERYKREVGIQIRVMKMNSGNDRITASEEADNGYIMSDTLMLMNTARVADAALSLRGYIYCPFINVMKMADMTVPGIMLMVSFCFGTLYFYLRRKETSDNKTGNTDAIGNKLITFGDLSLSTNDSCIYDQNSNRLSLTPMEYSLMEMFYRTSSHFLLKKDICDRLWPGKDNADETLYALIRRLKQTLSEHSSIKVCAVRGRAYQLEINEID